MYTSHTLRNVSATQHQSPNGTIVDHKRKAQIHVKVSMPEKQKFEKMAKERHTDISELVRQLLHREADAQRA